MRATAALLVAAALLLGTVAASVHEGVPPLHADVSSSASSTGWGSGAIQRRGRGSWQLDATPVAHAARAGVSLSAAAVQRRTLAGRRLQPLTQCTSEMICSAGSLANASCVVNSSTVVPGGCVIQAHGDLIIGNGVALTCNVSMCELQLTVGGSMTLNEVSSVQGSSILVDVAGDLTLGSSASLSASNKGPIAGRGEGKHGNGGSNGGAGGRLPCSIISPPCCNTGSYYSPPAIIGDAINPLSKWDDAYGSGGGPSGGQGGGRVSVNVGGVLTVGSHASISADGAQTSSSNGGSGSGGTVVINATDIQGSGHITADGGPGSTAKALAGGGGGRVVVECDTLALDTSLITAGGGTSGTPQNKCLDAGAGTVVITQRQSNVTGGYSRSYTVANNQGITYATTPVNFSLAEAVTSFTVSNGAVAAAANVQMANGTAGVIVRSAVVSSLVTNALGTPVNISAPVVSLDSSTLTAGGASVHIRCQTLTLDATSEISFESVLSIIAAESVTINGEITQSAMAAPLGGRRRRLDSVPLLGSVVGIDAGSTLTVAQGASVRAEVVALYGQSVSIQGQVQSSRYTCPSSIDYRRTCAQVLWKSGWVPPFTNYSLIVNSVSSEVVAGASIQGGAILVCSKHIEVDGLISATALGCDAGDGIGAGSTTSAGGAGAGHGGWGGNTTSGIGGAPYGGAALPQLCGSGGGGQSDSGGAGGGVIVVRSEVLVLTGNITADGQSGEPGFASGGGAGGSVVLRTLSFPSGDGLISASGGFATGNGGGGAGGRMLFSTSWSLLRQHPCFRLAVASATARGQRVVRLPSVDDPVVPLPDVGTCYGGDSLACVCPSVWHWVAVANTGPTRRLSMSIELDDGATADDAHFVAATANVSRFMGTGQVLGGGVPKGGTGKPGAKGTISSYNCAAGTGGLFCATCPVGTYKAETGNGPCLACSDKPEMAEYVQSGVTSAACPYVCKQGYNTADCLSQFQAVIRALGGLFGFFACVLALLLLTAGASLAVYWRRKRADRLIKADTAAPLMATAAAQSKRYGSNALRATALNSRLREDDLPAMAYRIYLSGSNTASRPWFLEPTPPAALLPFVDAAEFAQFADTVSEYAAWPTGCAAERVVLWLLRIVSFPLSRLFLHSRRKQRCDRIRNFVMQTDHTFMKGVRARSFNNALRFGASTDLTLGHIDVLHDEWSRRQPANRDREIGQPRLPLMLVLAGTGTFFSPFFLDANDVLLRALPLCRGLASFIDKEWVDFVAEFNNRARLISRGAVERTAGRVLRLLEEYNAAPARLGGIRVSLMRTWPGVVDPPPTRGGRGDGSPVPTMRPHAHMPPAHMLEREHTSGQSHTLFSMRTRSSGNVLKEEGYGSVVGSPEAALNYLVKHQQLAILLEWVDGRAPHSTSTTASAAVTLRAGSELRGASRADSIDSRPSSTMESTRSLSGLEVERLPSVGTTPGARSPFSPDEFRGSSVGRDPARLTSLAEEADALRRHGIDDGFDSDDDNRSNVLSHRSDSSDDTGQGSSQRHRVRSAADRAVLAPPLPPWHMGATAGTHTNGGGRRTSSPGGPRPASTPYQPGMSSAFGLTPRMHAAGKSHRSRGSGQQLSSPSAPLWVHRGVPEPLDMTTPYPSFPITLADVDVASQPCQGGCCRMVWWRLVRSLFRTSRGTQSKAVYVLLLCVMALLLLVDVIGCGIMLLELFCIQSDSITPQTQLRGPECQHTGFWGMVLIPPFAIAAAPLFGLIAVALQTASSMRSYAVWNAMSMVPAVGSIALSVVYRRDLPWFVIYLGAPYLVCKLLVAQIIPVLIAFPETARTQRGWTGLAVTRRGGEYEANVAFAEHLNSIMASQQRDAVARSSPRSMRRRGESGGSGSRHTAYEPLSPSPARHVGMDPSGPMFRAANEPEFPQLGRSR